MSRKPELVATSNVIKWTEEEWQMIASRLLEEKGRGLLKSTQLDEVKAKDVFNAQGVLPESRHRKLISISQGFQAIRQRLHGIMQKIAVLPAEDLFAAPTPGVRENDSTADEAAADQSSSQRSGRSRKARSSPIADMPSEAAQEAVDTTEPLQAVGQELPLEGTSASKVSTPIGKQTQQAAPRDVPSPAQPTQQALRHDHSSQTLSQSTGHELIELTRPFVAMMCEEFASALFKTLIENGGQQAIASLLQAVRPGVATSPVHRQQDHRSRVPSPNNEGFGSGQDSMSAAPQTMDDEDAHFAESDVQPLFDPKLPPSANSAFKPMIALIATSPRDFEDLKQFYPQLELNIVALDDLRTAPSLRSCQRMIGLREDIPAPADEFLRKAFRNRYVRITGGIGQIREQLNAWLDNPVTMNTGAPSWPRKQGNGKGQGTGFPKKKQFRRPRPNP